MAKNYLIIGAGMQGKAIGYDILKHDKTATLGIVDNYEKKAIELKDYLKKEFPRRDIEFLVLNANEEFIVSVMENFDVAIGAASYSINERLTRAAIRTGTHFCDLGGNNTVVRRQFEYHEQAKEAGVKVIPDTGITPGATSIVVSHGIDRMRELGFVKPGSYPTNVHLRVGGLPQNPKGPLNYQIVFSVQGLINEYIEPVQVLREGKKTIIEPMSDMALKELESLVFMNVRKGPASFEAFHTSGGASTMIETYEGKIKELDCKTLRYMGHFEKIRFMHEMGFFRPGKLEEGSYKPGRRDHIERWLKEDISYNEEDLFLFRVMMWNEKMENAGMMYEFIDYFDEETGHTSLQRTTGYSTAIIAQMLAHDVIEETGVLCQEKSVPAKAFIDEWRKRNINLEEHIAK